MRPWSAGPVVASSIAACGSVRPAARRPRRPAHVRAPAAADARFCPACGVADRPASASAAHDRRARPGAEDRDHALRRPRRLDGARRGARSGGRLPLVGGVFERIGEEVRRYEGTIEKFAGDAMLAVFGVPAIHEDDAERAVRAALEMQAAIGRAGGRAAAPGRLRPRLRIGIDTGEVLVDLDRASGARDLFVTGDAVNTAARLQAAAEPGTVVVGRGDVRRDARRRRVRGAAAGGAQGQGGPRSWPGGRSPSRLAAAVCAARSASRRRSSGATGGARAAQGDGPPGGRRRTAAAGHRRRARAGVGKSRLTWELEKYLDGLPEPYHWRKGRCLVLRPGELLGPRGRHQGRTSGPRTTTRRRSVIDKLEARLAELEDERPTRRSAPSCWRRSASRATRWPASASSTAGRGTSGSSPSRGPARPRARGHPLGGRRPARLHRVPRALGRGPDRHPLPRPPRAARAAADLGRRHPERGDDRPRAARARTRRARSSTGCSRAACRRRSGNGSSGSPRATRSSPRSSSGCSSTGASSGWPTGPGSWRGRSRRSRSRRPSRRSSRRGSTACQPREAAGPERRGRRSDLLGRPGRPSRPAGSRADWRPAPSPAGQGARRAAPAVVPGRRRGVRVPPRARPRRGLRLAAQARPGRPPRRRRRLGRGRRSRIGSRSSPS